MRYKIIKIDSSDGNLIYDLEKEGEENRRFVFMGNIGDKVICEDGEVFIELKDGMLVSDPPDVRIESTFRNRQNIYKPQSPEIISPENRIDDKMSLSFIANDDAVNPPDLDWQEINDHDESEDQSSFVQELLNPSPVVANPECRNFTNKNTIKFSAIS